MTVGNVVNLLFSFPHYPQLSRGRCLLGAKRFLGSLKYSAWMRSIISGDAIAPSITKARVLVISGDVIAPLNIEHGDTLYF